MPKFRRWKVTLLTGLITTIAAFFPALVMRLLDFVALYGLILMPMGAIILIDFYLVPKMGMVRDHAKNFGLVFSWPAAVTWLATLTICLFLNMNFGIDIFFLGLPGWFIASLLYLITNKIFQSSRKPSLSLN
jgi:purine-cytosine permease-like protein